MEIGERWRDDLSMVMSVSTTKVCSILEILTRCKRGAWHGRVGWHGQSVLRSGEDNTTIFSNTGRIMLCSGVIAQSCQVTRLVCATLCMTRHRCRAETSTIVLNNTFKPCCTLEDMARPCLVTRSNYVICWRMHTTMTQPYRASRPGRAIS